MLETIAFLVGLFASPEDVEQLRSTAPSYLTSTTAREHLGAARLAAVVTGTRTSLLLSIAWHESRFYVEAVTKEPENKISCGVMTPIPQQHCQRETLAKSYLTGAWHLRDWIDAAGSAWAVGYAGGWKLIKLCRAGSASRGCWIHQVFLQRARWIESPSRKQHERHLGS